MTSEPPMQNKGAWTPMTSAERLADRRSRMSDVPARAAAPQGPNHALLIGEALGALMAAGLFAEVIDDEHGTHLDTIRVQRPSGTWLVRVEPEAAVEL